MEAGLPKGIMNVVHGDKEMVDAILDHPDIKAVSFVGSSDVAQYIYGRGAAAGKRMQCMGGAKNHGIVMPDADLDQAVQDIPRRSIWLGRRALHGAAGGRAGRREDRRSAARAASSRKSPSCASASRPTRTRITARWSPPPTRRVLESYIQMAADEGAEMVVDGRGFSLQGHEAGFFLGPTLLDHVKPEHRQLPGGAAPRDLRQRHSRRRWRRAGEGRS